MLLFDRIKAKLKIGVIVIALLSISYSISFATEKEFNSVISAIDLNDISLLESLFKSGISPNLQIDSRASPTFLTYSASRGKNKIISVIAAFGGDIDGIDGDGYTPLIWATWKGHFNTVELLLSLGADKFYVAPRRESAMQLAKENRNTNIYTLLKNYPVSKLSYQKRDEIENFVHQFVHLGEGNQLKKVMDQYDDNVNYYKKGNVTKVTIKEDKRNYFSRWPSRTLSLETPILIGVDNNLFFAKFNYTYKIKNKKKAFSGIAWNKLLLNFNGQKFLIVSEQGGIVKD